MNYQTFIDKVQEATQVDSREDAEQIADAVLETLGERLERTVREDVSSQLPCELQEKLAARAGNNTTRYDLPEFYNRVGARADMKYYDAAERSWQVMSVFQQAISEGGRRDILANLPSEFAELFGENVPNRQRPKP